MGVNGLPGEIKNATGIAPAKMNGKEFHVDMNGTYYGLMKARAYSVVQKYTTTLTRNTEPANLHMPQMEDAPERPESTDSASPDPNDAQADLLRRANMLFGLKDKLAMVTSGPNSPDSVVVDKDGMLQDGTDQQRVMFFGHIADELYRKLSQFCTPEDESVTLHFDGEPSIQKQAEHRARDDKLRKGTDALHQAIEQARVVGGSRRKAAYKRCRNLYKPTTVIQGEVIAELIKKYDCHVCLCRFQSDTCIAKLCAQSLNPQDIIVVSGDSDLICFGAVPRVLYPIGKSRELTLFEKDAILEVLDLPSERHLLLAAVVTGNDYTRGVPYFGIKKICEIIREMELPGSDVESFHWYVHEFLVRVRHQLLSERVPRKKRKRIDSQLSVTVDDFEHALSAFVGVQEDAVSSVDQNPHPQPFTSQQHTSIEQGGQRDCNAHEIVMRALLDLEYQKVAEAQARAAMGFTPPMEDKKPAPKTNVNRTRTAKTQRARREAAKRNRKRKKWRKSRFKSRTDNQVRYSPHRVSDPSTATPVSDNQLSTMSPSQPKKRPVDKQPKAVEDSPSASSSSSTDRSSKNKRRKASSKKKLARPRDIDATPTAPKLKDAFKFAFPTITQTVGSLKGCLRRSLRPLGISDDQVDTIASRLEKATSLINEARPHVFRMIQLFLLEEVTTVFSPQGASGETNVDLLDLVMNKASGQMFIRGLMSLALNGKIVEKKCKKSESIRARELAQKVYARYKTIIPHFSPINTTDIPLGDMQMEFGLATMVCLHTHFRKLPSTVTGKMVKLGWSKDIIPLVDGNVPPEAQRQQDDDALDESPTTEPLGSDEYAADDDGCYKFKAGFLRDWWDHLLSLPAEKRPVFCPQPKLRGAFVMIPERAVWRILWGGTARNNPAKTIVETILSRAEASDCVDSDYGKVLETLFYGRRRPVGHDNDGGPDLRRTPYAKRTTRMAELAEGDPSRFGYRSLQDYCNRKLAYLRAAANCRDEGVPCTQSPPEFPANPSTKSRYALNNMIRSNGLELQVLAYDTKHEPHGALDPVMRIEKVMPDEDAIARIFQGKIPQCRGWDPGELVTAALCLIEHEREWNGAPDPGDPPVTNLMIRRAALYSPTTAARSERERVKNRKLQVVPGESIDGGIWARGVDPKGARTDVQSIQEIESCLPPKGQVTVEDFEDAVRVRVSREPLLREFEGSLRMKKAAWEEKKAVRAELDMAVAAILRFCGPEPCLIAIGNGKFRTGINLASKHETLQSHFAKKARAHGHIVVLVDEYLSSTVCPACTARGETSRMAKPTSRSCVCLVCGRWINRDSVGAHNIALIAEQWLFDQSRPISLLRPSV